ncbi:MerR family transcriptional regulator [Shewanella salipaludis]|uniref:MerR family transcriptional regulator n=1 Tax=Shewanella salipaludis TaxID=2723052 RepID=A0A972FT50_9GAMM|nr:MerR family transcriptional regulator [Shewanella salipaludis]NMH65695.1 MerR family transcriptional regulator [Shewanella salipaludis]
MQPTIDAKNQTTQATADGDSAGLYPIGEVSRLTGVNAVTLRAWQRRFGLVIPKRTPKGHRLYSAADIAQIREICRWLERGVAISKVKPLLAPGPAQTSALPQGQAAAQAQIAQTEWPALMQQLTQALLDFNAARLHGLLDANIGLYPFGLLRQQLLQPWLDEVGLRLSGRLDAKLLLSWLYDQLSVRFAARRLGANKQARKHLLLLRLLPSAAPAAAIGDVVSEGAWESMLVGAELSELGVGVTDLGAHDLAALPLVLDRLSPDALLLLPGPGYSAGERANIAAQLAALPLECHLYGRFALTLSGLAPWRLTELSALLASSETGGADE